jgi:hypothetical protein
MRQKISSIVLAFLCLGAVADGGAQEDRWKAVTLWEQAIAAKGAATGWRASTASPSARRPVSADS